MRPKTADASTPEAASDCRVQALSHEQPGGPKPVDDTALAALQLLLRVENEAREAGNVQDLSFLIANETRKLTRARQIFVVEFTRAMRPRIAAVSSVGSADRNSPLNQSIETVISRARNEHDIAETFEFSPEDFTGTGVLDAYPLRQLVWTPMKLRDGTVFAGMVQARETVWTERDLVVSGRLANVYAHSWAALRNRRKPQRRTIFTGKFAAIALAAIAALMLVPVPMTALAPSEIVAKSPGIVSAPIDGVVEEVLVEPNTRVKAGQSLVRFTDTTLRNKYQIAEREVQVARARLKRTNQLAFADMRGRHELGIARAELALRISERDYTKALLEKAVVKADRAGIAVFRDKKELVGKPVTTGERLIAIADPERVQLRINMPVADGYILEPGAVVKVFLDSDPLNPMRARIISADYEARALEGSHVAFRAVADLEAGSAPPRLGVRGTAQVYGGDVALGLYLLRRPIAAVRQWIGI